MPLAISTSALPETLVTSLITHGEDKVDVSSCLDHLYVPHGRYSRLFGQKLRCLGKGVMLRGEHLFQPKPWLFPILQFSREGYHVLSQKGHSWSPSYRDSIEDVSAPSHFYGLVLTLL